MHPLAQRRTLAHLTDCAGYLAVSAATIPLGVAIVTTTDLGRRPAFAHLISMVPPAIATVLAARAESGPLRATWGRSEEHTSELQSRGHLVCRLLLEKKNLATM